MILSVKYCLFYSVIGNQMQNGKIDQKKREVFIILLIQCYEKLTLADTEKKSLVCGYFISHNC